MPVSAFSFEAEQTPADRGARAPGRSPGRSRLPRRRRASTRRIPFPALRGDVSGGERGQARARQHPVNAVTARGAKAPAHRPALAAPNLSGIGRSTPASARLFQSASLIDVVAGTPISPPAYDSADAAFAGWPSRKRTFTVDSVLMTRLPGNDLVGRALHERAARSASRGETETGHQLV